MKIIKAIFPLLVLLIMSSCKKKLTENGSVPGVQDSSSNLNRVVALTREVAEILEQVYRDNAACMEVYAAIKCGYYHDERVLLKDLLFPWTSDLYSHSSFTDLNIDTGVFRKKFCEILLHGSYPLLKAEIKPVLFGRVKKLPVIVESNSRIPDLPGILSSSQPIAIYFPYSENFLNLSVFRTLPADNKIAILKKPTLVTGDRDADMAPGKAPYYCPDSPGNLCYRVVDVDDNYAAAKPTHIITTGGTINHTSLSAVPKTELVHRIYHGTSKLTKQMDRLISLTGNGGGSEIKVCRINGYLRRIDEQIDDFAGDVVTLHYTRGEIRNKRWKRVFSIWDPNWNYQDVEQIYAVYEEDTKGTRTIEGSLKTTLNLPSKLGETEGDIGFSIKASTQDEIITQRKLDRKSFLKDGLSNQGWGFTIDYSDFLPGMQDWPVMDGGSIWQYTMPYRIY